jgi:hypothetical protein
MNNTQLYELLSDLKSKNQIKKWFFERSHDLLDISYRQGEQRIYYMTIRKKPTIKGDTPKISIEIIHMVNWKLYSRPCEFVNVPCVDHEPVWYNESSYREAILKEFKAFVVGLNRKRKINLI